jgi:hypothetical protein
VSAKALARVPSLKGFKVSGFQGFRVCNAGLFTMENDKWKMENGKCFRRGAIDALGELDTAVQNKHS